MSIGDLVQEIKNPSVAQLMAAYPTMDALNKAIKMGKVPRTTEVGIVAETYGRIIADAMAKQAQANTSTVLDERLAMGAPPQAAGLAAVPVREEMFQETMTGATGGLVAMAGGGDVPRYQNQGLATNPSFSTYLQKRQEEERVLLNMGYEPEEIAKMPAQMKSMIASGKAVHRGDPSKLEQLPGERGDIPVPKYGPLTDTYGQTPPMDPVVQAAMEYKPPVTNISAPSISMPAAPGERKIGDFMADARGAFSGIKKPDALTYEGVMEERNKRLAALGVDPKFFTTEAGKVEKEIEGLGNSRTEAANMRLLEAGLNILGGTSPYAFENIGKGASAALKGFQEDIKDLNKQKRDLVNAQRQLRIAQNEMDTKGSDAAAAKVEARKDQILNLENQIEQNSVALAGTFRAAAENRDWQKYSSDVQIALGKAQMDFRARLAELDYNKPTEVRKAIDDFVDRYAVQNKFTPDQKESLRTTLIGQELGVRLRPKGGDKGSLTEKQNFDILDKALTYADEQLKSNSAYPALEKAAGKGDEKARAEIQRLKEQYKNKFLKERGMGSENTQSTFSGKTMKFDAQGNPVQ